MVCALMVGNCMRGGPGRPNNEMLTRKGVTYFKSTCRLNAREGILDAEMVILLTMDMSMNGVSN